MYNIVPRFPEHYVKDDSLVGPTSYFVSNLECPCKESTYPFTAKGNRFKVIKTSQTPSPAHYYPKYRKYRILGGKSLQYSTPRVCFVPKKKQSRTQLDSFFRHFTETKVGYSRTSTIGQRSAFKNWYKCRKSDVPDKAKKLIRQVSASTPLPQYLTFPGETSKATLKYKGSRWSWYTGERKSITISTETPGPAAYNIEQEIVKKPRVKPDFEERKTQTIKCPVSPEETRQPCRDTTHGDVIKTTHYFDGTCDYLYKKVSHNKGSTVWNKAERFIYRSSENPPPWAYSLNSIHCVRKIIKNVPFSCCSPRFKVPKKTDLSPASYNQEYATIKESSCRLLPLFRGTLMAPFGSTVPRLEVPIPEYSDEEEEPQKQDYLKVSQLIPPTTKCQVTKAEVATSESPEDREFYQVVGTSLVLRDILDEEPCYVDMRDVFSKHKEKRCHRVPVENEGFLTTAADRTSWVIAKTTAHDVDWAAIDNVKVKGGAIKMDYPVHNANPKPKQDHSVYYDIHPRYSSSVYKSTHNYRLKTDFEIEKTYENPDNVKTILKCFMPKEILYA